MANNSIPVPGSYLTGVGTPAGIRAESVDGPGAGSGMGALAFPDSSPFPHPLAFSQPLRDDGPMFP
jgi:hypothetical protein